MLVDSPTDCWVTDYLVKKLQFVHLSAALSDMVVRDMGAPQLFLPNSLTYGLWNHLLLNMVKTREMVIDFRKKRTATGRATQRLCTKRG